MKTNIIINLGDFSDEAIEAFFVAMNTFLNEGIHSFGWPSEDQKWDHVRLHFKLLAPFAGASVPKSCTWSVQTDKQESWEKGVEVCSPKSFDELKDIVLGHKPS